MTLTVFTYIFVKVIFSYIAPFVAGYLISLIMEPFIRLLTDKNKINRGVAALLCVLLIAAFLGGIGTGIILKLVAEAKSFISGIPDYVQDIALAFDRLKGLFSYQFSFIPDSFQHLLHTSGQTMMSGMTGSLGEGIKQGSLNIVVSIPSVILGFLLSVISAFFFMKDKHMISHFMKAHSPSWLMKKTKVMKDGVIYAIKGYFKAQLALMSITAIICISGLLILGYPYALFVGLGIAAVDALPVFGTGMILWPWAAYYLIMDDYMNAVGLLAIYGIVFIVRQSLEPRILGAQIGIHPLVTLMSIYIGLKVFGVPGLFLGPALVVIVKMINEMNIDSHKT